MKYPVLIMGLLMFYLFISNIETQIWLGQYVDRFKPNDCRVQLDKVLKKNEFNWSVNCKDGNLIITHTVYFKTDKKGPELKKIYRQLANDYSNLARISNYETLERIPLVKINLIGENHKINSSSTGSDTVLLKKITDPTKIARHLKFTVKVKEL